MTGEKVGVAQALEQGHDADLIVFQGRPAVFEGRAKRPIKSRNGRPEKLTVSPV
jgi:hypothetical protein